MSWLLLAIAQLSLLTVLLLVSAAWLRRAQQHAPSKQQVAGTSPASVAARPLESAIDTDHLQQAIANAELAAAELKAGWQRVRGGLHKVLESAQPVLEHSSWGEMQRLLCAADQLIGTPSPALTFREDSESEQTGRWGTLMSGLSQLRTAAASTAHLTDPDEAEPATLLNDDTSHAILGALIVAVDELRSANPEAARHESSREIELRQMILQFTHDSRDMLSCIRRLESENATLRSSIPTATADAA